MVEEAVVGFSGELFDDGAEVFGDDAIEGVALQVGFDTAVIEFVAELASEHMEDPAAFGVGSVIELIPG